MRSSARREAVRSRRSIRFPVRRPIRSVDSSRVWDVFKRLPARRAETRAVIERRAAAGAPEAAVGAARPSREQAVDLAHASFERDDLCRLLVHDVLSEPVLPVVTATTPAPTAPGTTTLTRWNVADGYTLVLASVPNANGRASAVQIARRALDQGLPDVGILDSTTFSGLAPGFFVVFTGIYTSNADAAARLTQARTAGFTAAYVRRITR